MKTLLLWLLLIAAIGAVMSGRDFCARTPECLHRIRKMAAQTTRFWFGDSWRLSCGGFAASRMREQNPIKCMNPRELSPYTSLGARLFHARTFTPAYLENLSIYPRMSFFAESGSYRACEHDFQVLTNQSRIDAHPQMEPMSPFLSRNSPEFTWPELEPDSAHIIALVDVGFGQLKYLAVDFPRNTRVLKAYEIVENFRFGQPTPLALLVFRSTAAANRSVTENAEKWANERLFDLTAFMMGNHLEAELIGLNWALIGADAYAMERQRLRGSVDNCHSLIQKKLQRDRRFEFADSFRLSEMDSSLSASFHSPEAHFEVCCRRVDTEDKEAFLDPLSDTQLPSDAVRSSPTVTSLRSIETENDNYQRSLRHYIAMKEDKYTLVMFDPHRHYLYWLVSDIPSGALAAGTLTAEGSEIASYLAPSRDETDRCGYIVLMLFRQPRLLDEVQQPISAFFDESLRSFHCVGHCVHRSGFDIAQFKAFHRLRLSAVSWFGLCFDEFAALRRLRQIRTDTDIVEPPRPHRRSNWSPMHRRAHQIRDADRTVEQREAARRRPQRDRIADVCAAIRPDDRTAAECELDPSGAAHHSLATTAICLVFLIVFG